MKSALIFCSPHGRTRKVVEHALQELAVKPDVFDLKDAQPTDILRDYDLLLVFCPTYGDEELPEAMENYILNLKTDLTGRLFTICELGNYYGYDDYCFGAMNIIRQCLEKLGARELCSPLSFDSLPKVNWNHLSNWVRFVNDHLAPKTS